MNPLLSPESKLAADGATVRKFEPQTVQEGKGQSNSTKPVIATPFQWVEPSAIPRRDWIYPRTFCRKFVTGTIAPGGVGKTGLGLVECLAMVTGRDLLNDDLPAITRRTWYFNGEDPQEEMTRQVIAAMLHYDISPNDIDGRLFIDSGRGQTIKVAHSQKSGFSLNDETIEAVTRTIIENKIDVAVFDPLVSVHAVPENSNEAMDAVVKAFAQIANDTNCAIGLAAHTRKQQAGAHSEVTSDDARGGKALVDGARIIRVLNRMSENEAEQAGIIGDTRKRYFRLGGDKLNLTPPDSETSWRYMESVSLPNGPLGGFGDSMRVVTAWAWPSAFDDVTTKHLDEMQRALNSGDARNRESNQASNWAGHLLASILAVDTAQDIRGKSNLSADQKAARAKCRAVLTQWITAGALRTEQVYDDLKKRNYLILIAGARDSD